MHCLFACLRCSQIIRSCYCGSAVRPHPAAVMRRLDGPVSACCCFPGAGGGSASFLRFVVARSVSWVSSKSSSLNAGLHGGSAPLSRFLAPLPAVSPPAMYAPLMARMLASSA
uniref:Uncharacterized protein n=1 Tax=Arundo donax TaxID=35708 RepID=A0A0A8YPN4_ARUDO